MSAPEAYTISVLVGKAFWTWLQRLGGPGLLIIGIIDASAVPLPGSIDVFLIILVAHRPQDWLYYAFMATLGAVAGGYLTYRLAEKGEQETLEKRIGQNKAKNLYQRFKTHGFATVAVAALLPPPLPTFPVLLTAGALHFPRKNFLGALSAGRAVRYLALAYAAHIYGKKIIGLLSRYTKPILYAFIAVVVLGAVIGIVYYLKWYRPQKKQQRQHHEQPQHG